MEIITPKFGLLAWAFVGLIGLLILGVLLFFLLNNSSKK